MSLLATDDNCFSVCLHAVEKEERGKLCCSPKQMSTAYFYQYVIFWDGKGVSTVQQPPGSNILGSL